MDQRFVKIFHAVYVNSRRVSHALLRRFPLADRAIGDPLRLLTRTWEGRIVSHAVSNPLQVDGLLILHRSEDASLISRLKLHAYEKEVHDQIIKILRAGMTMVDVGAHIGWYSLLAARLVGPNGNVYAFEAVPYTAEALRNNVAINNYNNITVIQSAVSNSGEQLPIFIDELSSSSSTLFANRDDMKFLEVDSTTLDEFFERAGWPSIDLIKLDIEGAEKLALDGMHELSRRNPSLKAIVEVNLRKFTIEALIAALKGCGFSRFYALELGRTIIAPQDTSSILSASRSITVNLLCEKATGSVQNPC